MISAFKCFYLLVGYLCLLLALVFKTFSLFVFVLGRFGVVLLWI